MSRSIAAAVLLCAGWLVACDDGSGIPGGKLVVSLSDGEIKQLCEYLDDVAGPGRTIVCPGGGTVVVGGGRIAECLADLRQTKMQFPSCTGTVGELERCTEDFVDLSDAELCADEIPLPASCLPLATAECGGF